MCQKYPFVIGKCIVATLIDAHTSESRWRHTSVCARSRRVEESSKTYSSPSARAIFTHTWTCLHLLPRTQRRYPCDGACSARASTLSMFSQRGFEGKKHFRSFSWIFNMLHYIPLLIIYDKSTLVIVDNLQEIIV